MAFIAACLLVIDLAPSHAQFSAHNAFRAVEDLQRQMPRQWQQGRQQPQVSNQRNELRLARATVRQAQEMLNALGYNAGPEDGISGPRTRRALSDFQSSVGLRRTGAPDAQTMEALTRALDAQRQAAAEPA